MTNKETKAGVLGAARETLKSYLNGTHIASTAYCSICLLAGSGGRVLCTGSCAYCILKPFASSLNDTGFCYSRKCKPIGAGSFYKKKQVKQVILFWEKVIGLIEKTPEDEFVDGWIDSEWWRIGLIECDDEAFNEITE